MEKEEICVTSSAERVGCSYIRRGCEAMNSRCRHWHVGLTNMGPEECPHFRAFNAEKRTAELDAEVSRLNNTVTFLRGVLDCTPTLELNVIDLLQQRDELLAALKDAYWQLTSARPVGEPFSLTLIEAAIAKVKP